MKKGLLFITLLAGLLAVGCNNKASSNSSGGGEGGGGSNPVQEEFVANFTLSSADSVTVDGITVSFSKASGQSDPAWYDNGLRLYANNEVTVSYEGELREIVFNWQVQGSKDFNTCTANVGEYTHPETAGEGLWSGSDSSVVFTLGDKGQLLLNTFSVTAFGYKGGEGEWPQEILDLMNQYLPEPLPYVALNFDSINYGYDSDYGCLFIEDDNETNLLGNYASLLGEIGYTYNSDYDFYTKLVNDFYYDVTFGWVEAGTNPEGIEYAAGNCIYVYISSANE